MDSRDVSMIAREVAMLHLLCARFTVLLVSSLLLVPVARVSAQEATPEASPVDAQSRIFNGPVDIGGRSLYLECRGVGAPTVILEGGLDTAATEQFVPIVPGIARFTRVCAYDRANLGLSDTAPTPRTVADLADDLHALLAAADVPGPYVLVAASYGGLVARLFAHTYPAEVAGIVLIDSTHEDQDDDMEQTLGPELWAELLATGYMESVEGIDFATSNEQVRRARASSPLPTVPVISLTAPLPTDEPFEPGWPLAMNDVFRAENADLAMLAPGERWIVVEGSGHNIHYDRPAVVIDAVGDVVDAVRDPSTWATPATPAP
jgi:pimeloyl-ACP methyl ester carboxylesterase